MIGTHDAATGEEASGWFSRLVEIFSRTQRHTLKEQFDLGVRYMDIRLGKYVSKFNGKKYTGWNAAHGLWTSKHTVHSMLNDLETHIAQEFATGSHDEDWYYVVVDLTLERNCKRDLEEFEKYIKDFLKTCEYRFVKIRYIGIKYDENKNWKTLAVYEKGFHKQLEHKFKCLRIDEWACLWPFPSFWDKHHKWTYNPSIVNSFDFWDINKLQEVTGSNPENIVTWQDF